MRLLFKSCLILTVFFTTLGAVVSYADIELPAPRKEGGIGVLEPLNRRGSAPGSSFSSMKISDEDLSTILWAATGPNRDGAKWTVPMAMGVPPYVKIYAVLENGAFLYDWKEHKLKEIVAEDARTKIGAQAFVASAPCSLVFVSDGEALMEKFKNEDAAKHLAGVATGAMTQNIYLAAAALDLNVRYVQSVKADEVRSLFKLDKTDLPICLVLLGK